MPGISHRTSLVTSRLSRRQRILAAALALVTGIAVLPFLSSGAQADELVDLTLLYHGSVQGKIAPCG